MKLLSDDKSYFLLPISVLDEINKFSPQAPIVKPGWESDVLFWLQAVRVAKPFSLLWGEEGAEEAEGIAFLTRLSNPIWVADAPDLLELSAKSPIWALFRKLVKEGDVKVRFYSVIEDANVPVCGSRVKGWMNCVASGYIEDLQRKAEEGEKAHVRGEAVLELVPKNSGL